MTAKPRREEILKLLGTTSVLSVGELADHFALSVVTIRKDLDDLASEGLLQRTFGGAVFSNQSLFNDFLRESARRHGPSIPDPKKRNASALEFSRSSRCALSVHGQIIVFSIRTF